MRYLIRFGFIIAFSLMLCACSSGTNGTIVLPGPIPSQEKWMSEIERNPNIWMSGADPWFISNNPYFGIKSRKLPSSLNNIKEIPVKQFTKIQIQGDFQVRLVGVTGKNSVTMRGPKLALNALQVYVANDTLYLLQAKKAPASTQQVEVAVDVNNLNGLIHLGSGRIEGMHLYGPSLDIISKGSGDIYLSGELSLRRLVNANQGSVNVFGVDTPKLVIETSGRGVTNVYGSRVGVQSIFHRGTNNINILGANSRNLRIYASGKGKIGIDGIVNLRELKALDGIKIYISKVRSDCLTIYAFQHAYVGLLGSALTVHLHANDNAFVGAKYLCGKTVYVRSARHSHVNVIARDKIFVSSRNNSSVYFFGRPSVLTPFASDNSTIIPIIR